MFMLLSEGLWKGIYDLTYMRTGTCMYVYIHTERQREIDLLWQEF